MVYFSEWHTGLVLALLRHATRASYRLVLCNGTMAGDGLSTLDRVQEITPVGLQIVLERGASPLMPCLSGAERHRTPSPLP